MTADQDLERRAIQVFESLLEGPKSERDSRLAERCGSDDALRRRVESLFAADTSELEVQGDSRLVDEFLTDRHEETVGPYRLLEPLGEGGMGTVWRAKRDDGEFEQEVALKLIRHGLDPHGMALRFRRERQVLARLQHDGIARLLDGGTADDGRPYLVMELVDGAPIDEYCADEELPLESRLALFAAMCEAVDAAHELGIIHRDLKPANMHVTRDGRPKLLDFGIAKILEPDGSEDVTLLTRTGERVLTPRYAAPEQVLERPTSTATDVYSLGVVLFELITGTSPYAEASESLHGLESAIVHDLPPRPSRVSTSFLGRRLPTDVDTIVMRTLAKEPERRYRSAGELTRDLRRFLAHEPISARRDTAAYRARTFVRRNRILVAATIAILTSLTVGLVVSWTQFLESERLRGIADERTAVAEWQAYVSALSAAHAATQNGRHPAAELEQAPEHLRGWEWYHLSDRVRRGSRLLYSGPSLGGLAVDGAGTTLVARTQDEVLVLDPGTGEMRHRHEAAPASHNYYRRIVISSDGRRVGFAEEGSVRIIDTVSGETLARFETGSLAMGLGFASDGHRLAVTTWSRLHVFDTNDRTTLVDVGLPSASRAVAFSPDGQTIAAATQGGVLLIQADDGETIAELEIGKPKGLINAIAFFDDGSHVSATTRHGMYRIWRTSDHQPVTAPRHMNSYTWELAARPGQDQLVLGAESVVTTNLHDGAARRVRLNDSVTYGLVCHPTKPLAYVAQKNGALLEVDLEHVGVTQRHVQIHMVNQVALRPGSNEIAIIALSVLIHDRNTGELLRKTPKSMGRAEGAVAYSPDGKTLLAHIARKTGIFDPDTLELRAVLPLSPKVATFSPDGTSCAVSQGDSTVVILATTDWQVLQTLEPGPTQIRGLAFDHETGELAVVGSGARPLAIVNRSSGVTRQLEADLGDGTCIAYSPDGKTLAAGFSEGVAAWSVPELEPLGEIAISTRALAFTPDGERLAIAHEDSLGLIDTAHWRMALLMRDEARRAIRTLAFSRDGRTLMGGDNSGDLLTWRTSDSR